MKDETITVRAAVPDDHATIVGFNQAMALETEGKTLNPATASASVRHGLADSARCKYFLAEICGEVAGQTMVTFEWSDWRNGFFWWIQSVYVDQPFRRRGVFQALYNHIRKLAKARPDVCGLRLYVHRDNVSARNTYTAVGMVVSDYMLCEEEWDVGLSNPNGSRA